MFIAFTASIRAGKKQKYTRGNSENVDRHSEVF